VCIVCQPPSTPVPRAVGSLAAHGLPGSLRTAGCAHAARVHVASGGVRRVLGGSGTPPRAVPGPPVRSGRPARSHRSPLSGHLASVRPVDDGRQMRRSASDRDPPGRHPVAPFRAPRRSSGGAERQIWRAERCRRRTPSRQLCERHRSQMDVTGNARSACLAKCRQRAVTRRLLRHPERDGHANPGSLWLGPDDRLVVGPGQGGEVEAAGAAVGVADRSRAPGVVGEPVVSR
jgi:hypothetical protein